MQVHVGVESLRAEWPEAVVCIGTFDGVHIGHQQVIRTAVDHALRSERPPLLLTFDRHPATVLAPDRCPPAVAPLEQRLEQFERLGVALTVVLAFDRQLADTEAEQFLQGILKGRLRASEIVVGHDFAFGHNRLGTPDWLKERIATHVVPPFELDGVRVSSSAIRRAVATGEVEQAGRLLGRPFELAGVVVAGQRLGRTLGYPTINLARSLDQVVPASGIYAAEAVTPHGVFKAAASVGTRPTVGGTHRTIEAYLLDYPGDSLYGHAVSLRFGSRLRDELDLGSVDALKAQMAQDIAAVRKSNLRGA